MDRLRFGDVVLLKFPFSDWKGCKKRPALILNDFEDGDIIVCRITSRIYNTPNDYCIDNWTDAGLKLPSVVRIHKIATLDKSLVEIKMGRLDNFSLESIVKIIQKIVIWKAMSTAFCGRLPGVPTSLWNTPLLIPPFLLHRNWPDCPEVILAQRGRNHLVVV